MVKAVLFDIDDTLINHSQAVKKAVGEFHSFSSLASLVSKEQLFAYWKEAESVYFKKYLSGKLGFKEQRILRIQYVYKKAGLVLNNKEAYDTTKKYMQVYKSNWQLFADVIPCLNALKEKYTLGIISNGDSVQQRSKLRKTAIQKYFSMVLISGDIGIAKPDKKIFIEALNRLRLAANEVLYVGDDLEKDFNGAKAAGINAVLMDRQKTNLYSVEDFIENIALL